MDGRPAAFVGPGLTTAVYSRRTQRRSSVMAIAISDAHRELGAVARSFLENNKARAASRALLDAPAEALPPFWDELAQLGWLGLHIPEEFAGSGYGVPELAV